MYPSPYLNTADLLANPIVLGILASLATDGIAVINKWLMNTKLKGKGAFVASLVVSAVATLYTLTAHYEFFIGGNMVDMLAQIFAISQVFYWFVMKFLKEKLGIST